MKGRTLIALVVALAAAVAVRRWRTLPDHDLATAGSDAQGHGVLGLTDEQAAKVASMLRRRHRGS